MVFRNLLKNFNLELPILQKGLLLLLLLFFFFQFKLPYVCRGAFNLNNFEDGVLSSAFMVGLLISSPIFASLAKRYTLLLHLVPNFIFHLGTVNSFLALLLKLEESAGN